MRTYVCGCVYTVDYISTASIFMKNLTLFNNFFVRLQIRIRKFAKLIVRLLRLTVADIFNKNEKKKKVWKIIFA